MNSKLRAWILYAIGCVLLLGSMSPRSAFAQPNETPASALDHTAGAHAVQRAERTGVVNLNTATAAELQRLPRVGPARAQAILTLRMQLKRFSKVEQLLRVKGIGRATFRKLRPLLALDGPTTLPERTSR